MKIEIYSKQNCQLCEDMLSAVRECIKELEIGADLKVTDIETDKNLEVYKLKLPVLVIDGKMFAKYEVSKEKLMKRLKRKKKKDESY